MGLIGKTIVGAALLGVGYVIGMPSGNPNYAVKQDNGKQILYDKIANEEIELTRINEKTFFMKPERNLEGFVKTSFYASKNGTDNNMSNNVVGFMNLLKENLGKSKEKIIDLYKQTK